MPRVIVFDVNETLLDVRALEPLFRRIFGDEKVLREWFSLLLLHSQVATLAGPYFDFATLAKAAIQMTAASRRPANVRRSLSHFQFGWQNSFDRTHRL